MKSKIVILMILVGALQSNAQTKFGVSAVDSMAFLLQLNGQQINQWPVVSMTLPNIASGKTNVSLTFPQRPDLKVTADFDFKPNSVVFYEVVKLKGKFKLQLVSESVSATPLAVTVQAQPSAPNAVEVASAMVDSVAVVLETGACENVTNTEEFESLKASLKDIAFENRRFEKMKLFVEGHCLKVDQLRYLMAQLNTEELKVKLLESGMGHVYDPQRLGAVEEDVFLERNKRRVKELVAQFNQTSQHH